MRHRVIKGITVWSIIVNHLWAKADIGRTRSRMRVRQPPSTFLQRWYPRVTPSPGSRGTAAKSSASYKIHGTELELVEEAKYLGVMLDKKLNFNSHMNATIKKCDKTRQFLQRNLRGCNPAVKASAYKTFVRPIADPECGRQFRGNAASRCALCVQRLAT